MKKTIAAAVFMLISGQVFAHGDLKPAHGGQIKEGKLLTLEVTVDPAMTMVYLTDHGQAVPSKEVSGEVILLDGATKSTIKLTSAGGNTLMGTGTKAKPGAKAIVKVTIPGKGEDQVRVVFP